MPRRTITSIRAPRTSKRRLVHRSQSHRFRKLTITISSSRCRIKIYNASWTLKRRQLTGSSIPSKRTKNMFFLRPFSIRYYQSRFTKNIRSTIAPCSSIHSTIIAISSTRLQHISITTNRIIIPSILNVIFHSRICTIYFRIGIGPQYCTNGRRSSGSRRSIGRVIGIAYPSQTIIPTRPRIYCASSNRCKDISTRIRRSSTIKTVIHHLDTTRTSSSHNPPTSSSTSISIREFYIIRPGHTITVRAISITGSV